MTNVDVDAAAVGVEEIYRRVFEAIVDHRLLPGTQLKEDILCDIYGVGRTRVRKVLTRLAADNIVDLLPHRGAFVAHPSVDEAKEVFRARRVIEGHLVHAAAQTGGTTRTGGTAARKILRRHLELERTAREQGQQSAAIRLCGQFHLVLADLADSPIMRRFLRELVSRTSLIVAIYEAQNAESCEMDEHKALAEAVISGRAEQAEALMTTHLDGIERRLNLQPPKTRQEDIREELTAGSL